MTDDLRDELKKAVKSGLTTSKADLHKRSQTRYIERTETDRQYRKIANGECPDCGALIRRYGGAETSAIRGEAGLSNGPNIGIGTWVMYRCSRDAPPGVYQTNRPCGFMLDQFESGEA